MTTPNTMPWTAADIPNQTGRTILVTGGTKGIGFEVAKELAKKNATVIMAGRNPPEHQPAGTSYLQLDLSNPDSIKRFATQFKRKYKTLDVLCNNAGILEGKLSWPDDQLRVNHLGHFALTKYLLSSIPSGGRVVTVASGAHKNQFPAFWQHANSNWSAYCRSKCANLLFTTELNKLLDKKKTGIIAVSASPGFARTALGKQQGWLGFAMVVGKYFGFSQTAAKGALPLLYAATAAQVTGGTYYGPDGFKELTGNPTVLTPAAKATDDKMAKRLWNWSEIAADVKYFRT